MAALAPFFALGLAIAAAVNFGTAAITGSTSALAVGVVDISAAAVVWIASQVAP